MLKKNFKVLARDDGVSIVTMPGDTFSLEYTRIYTSLETGRVLLTETKVVLEEEIKNHMHIDSVVVFEFENELGMKRGIGGAFGEKG